MHPQPFLGLDCLVQAVSPAPTRLQAAGELVDDDNLSVADDVVLVALLQYVGGEGVLDVVDHVVVIGIVQITHLGPLLHLGHALLGEGDVATLVVDGVVLVFPFRKAGHHLGKSSVELHRLFRWAADNQRCSCLVDQDVIHLVDDGIVAVALHLLAGIQGHVVAQVVEAELVVSAVGDVGLVGFPPEDGPQMAQAGVGALFGWVVHVGRLVL